MDNRLQQQLNDALDELLSPQENEQLIDELNTNQEASEEFDQLQKVHKLFRSPPQARAPERLATTIMARLAQRVEAESKIEELPEELREALLLSLSMIMMNMMPAMAAASWLVVNAQKDPKVFSNIAYRMVTLMTFSMDALMVLMEEAENLVQNDPESAQLALSLVPIVLLSVLEATQEDEYIEEFLSRNGQ